MRDSCLISQRMARLLKLQLKRSINQIRQLRFAPSSLMSTRSKRQAPTLVVIESYLVFVFVSIWKSLVALLSISAMEHKRCCRRSSSPLEAADSIAGQSYVFIHSVVDIESCLQLSSANAGKADALSRSFAPARACLDCRRSGCNLAA